MAQYQREMERQARAEDREQMRAVREAERAQRAYERTTAAEEKERKRLYVESRVAAVDALNEELESLVHRLETLLQETLELDDFFDLDTLKVTPELPPFQPGALAIAEPKPRLESFLPPASSILGRLVPGAKVKHAQAVAEAQAAYEHAVVDRSRANARASRRYGKSSTLPKGSHLSC